MLGRTSRALAAAAATTVAWLIVMPGAGAAAELKEAQSAEAVAEARLQSLEIPETPPGTPTAPPQRIERDEYTVTVVSVVYWPTTGPEAQTYSDGFGWRIPPCRGCSSDHHGVDLTPGADTEVRAVSDGVVVFAGWERGGLGQHVVIEHVIDGVPVQTTYGHMRGGSLTVDEGQQIEGGHVIGLVGSTGASTGAHLHFEVLEAGVLVDPYAWLLTHVNADDFPTA